MKKHFVLMDGLRGAAALSVGLLHASQIFKFEFGAHAELAVDFFFCLSGFVIAHSYQDALDSGRISPSGFFLKRFIRLYPMIFAGVVLAAFVSFAAALINRTSFMDVTVLAAGAFTLMPTGLLLGVNAFDLNNALWSLFFEFSANGAFALWHQRMQLWLELFLVATFGVVLFFCIRAENGVSAIGYEGARMFFEGFARVAYPFMAGILIRRWGLGRNLRIHFVVPLLLLLAMLFMPFFLGAWLYDALCVLIIVPAIIILAQSDASLGASAPAWAYAGAISYPFYILHQPIIRMGNEFMRLTHINVALVTAATLAGVVVLSHLALRFYDEPVRKALTARLIKRGKTAGITYAQPAE